MNKPKQIFSLQDAIKQGFKWAVEDGEEQGFDITHLTPDELAEYKKRQPDTWFWLCDKEEKYFYISPEDINESLGELATNQDQFNDEDGELLAIANDVFKENRELYEALSNKLNESLRMQGFLVPSDKGIDFNL